jgi:hypothetical protein
MRRGVVIPVEAIVIGGLPAVVSARTPRICDSGEWLKLPAL